VDDLVAAVTKAGYGLAPVPPPAAHWCSLVCIRRTRRHAISALGHGSPVFTSVSVPCSTPRA
ncbi:MAG: hypothetical protein ACRDRT_02380, partial [Pseudonocardiaceae bacterium]